MLFDPTDKALEYYLNELSDTQPLSLEEEHALFGRIKRGDTQARDRLVKANLRFVISVANKYGNQGMSLSDLISAGNVGLLTAVERFDETRGLKFISYAVWWIRQSILQTLSEHGRLVRIPVNRTELLRRINRYIADHQAKTQEMPEEKDIAEALGIPISQVTDTLESNYRMLSLDKPLRDDKETLQNLLPDRNQEMPDTRMWRNALKNEIADLLESLDLREQEVIRLYFGLDGDPWTLESIARKHQVTRERIRQIKEKALRKLRHPARGRKLQPYSEAV